MIRLVVAAIAVQLADVLTWLSLPAGAERNPVAAGAAPWEAWALKAALLVLVLAVAEIVSRRRRAVAEAVLLLAVIAGSIGTGSNLAALPR